MKKNIILVLCLFSLTTMGFSQKTNKPKQQTDSPILKDIMNKSYLPFIIRTSAEIGLFDILNDKSLSVSEISDALKTKNKITDALLIVLNTAKLLDYKDGKYSLAQISSDYWVTSKPKNQISWLNENAPIPTGKMANLKVALSGELTKPNKKDVSIPYWQNKENLVAMKNRVKVEQTKIIDFIESLPEFSTCRKMIDYAGSIGYYSMAILDKNAKLKACVYDLPEVCDIALEVQKNEKNFKRMTFHGFDIRNNDPFGNAYDLFFVSNALYGQRTKEDLVAFFVKANKSMKMGGLLISNHWTSQRQDENYFNMTMKELENSFHGRPVHYIEESILKQALTEAGFDYFTIKTLNDQAAKPRLLIATRKVKDLE